MSDSRSNTHPYSPTVSGHTRTVKISSENSRHDSVSETLDDKYVTELSFLGEVCALEYHDLFGRSNIDNGLLY